jgi:hypothetical protein
MCTERDTGRFYIGYRFKNYLPAEQDFGNRYFTSNKYVMKNFDRFDWKIIAEFYDKRDALKFEGQLIKETQCDLQINYDRIKNLKRKSYSL